FEGGTVVAPAAHRFDDPVGELRRVRSPVVLSVDEEDIAGSAGWLAHNPNGRRGGCAGSCSQRNHSLDAPLTCQLCTEARLSSTAKQWSLRQEHVTSSLRLQMTYHMSKPGEVDGAA